MALLRIAAAALIILAAILRIAHLDDVATRTPDERVYTAQATAFLQSGQPALAANVERYRSDPNVRLYPLPTRVGMVRLVAAAMNIMNRRDEYPGAVFSTAASIAAVFLLAVTGYRFFPPIAVLFALLFSAVSPIQLSTARRQWTDSLVELTGLGLIYIAAEIVAGSRKLAWYIAFGITAAFSLTIKEYMAVPIAICAAGVLWTLRRELLQTAIFLAISGTAIAIATIWMAESVGGFHPFFSAIAMLPASNAANTYALEYATGPGWKLLYAFFIIIPAASLLALAGAFLALKANAVLANITAVSIALILTAMFVPHWLNLRYVAPAFGTLYLLAGLAFARLCDWVAQRFRPSERPALVTIVALLCIVQASLDYSRFTRFFVADNIPDLTVKFLIDENYR